MGKVSIFYTSSQINFNKITTPLPAPSSVMIHMCNHKHAYSMCLLGRVIPSQLDYSWLIFRHNVRCLISHKQKWIFLIHRLTLKMTRPLSITSYSYNIPWDKVPCLSCLISSLDLLSKNNKQAFLAKLEEEKLHRRKWTRSSCFRVFLCCWFIFRWGRPITYYDSTPSVIAWCWDKRRYLLCSVS